MSQFLTVDTLHRKAPSIFALSGASNTSNKYRHISTLEVIEGLSKTGYLPVAVSQSISHLPEKQSYAKHMLRFRHQDAQPTKGGLFPEIVLINSHDGASSYRLLSGIYRLICSNGLVAGNTYSEVRIRHQGDIVGQVIEGTYEVVDNAHKMLATTQQMETVMLTEQEKTVFAEAAHRLRYEDSETGTHFNPSHFLVPRRHEERNKNDLFTVFNVLQENLIKGGIRGYARDKQGYLKNTRSRPVNGIDQSTILNRHLWTLTEKMMELKTA